MLLSEAFLRQEEHSVGLQEGSPLNSPKVQEGISYSRRSNPFLSRNSEAKPAK
jgi:hypothetical protein